MDIKLILQLGERIQSGEGENFTCHFTPQFTFEHTFISTTGLLEVSEVGIEAIAKEVRIMLEAYNKQVQDIQEKLEAPTNGS